VSCMLCRACAGGWAPCSEHVRPLYAAQGASAVRRELRDPLPAEERSFLEDLMRDAAGAAAPLELALRRFIYRHLIGELNLVADNANNLRTPLSLYTARPGCCPDSLLQRNPLWGSSAAACIHRPAVDA